MKIITKGGVFILLLFSIVTLHSTTLSSLYAVFDLPLKRVPAWLKQDRGSAVKDLFIAYQYLPAKNRKFSYTVPMQFDHSIDKKAEYRFFVVSVKRQLTLSFLLGGVKRGRITVNGVVRKEVKTTSPIDPILFKASFSAGNYLVVITVDERFKPDIEPILLATKKVPQSHKNSFTKNSSSTLYFSSIKPPTYHGFFVDWYTRHCFPTKNGKTESQLLQSDTLRSLLLKTGESEEELKLLHVAGFNDIMLRWWARKLSERGVCNVQKY